MISDSVAIVWYHHLLLPGHVSISVDDKLYGWSSSWYEKESKSLKGSIERLQGLVKGRSSKADMITVQYIKVTSQQKLEIERICKKKFGLVLPVWMRFPEYYLRLLILKSLFP